ncbi:MAG: peptidase S10 [Terriglobia bacterium]
MRLSIRTGLLLFLVVLWILPFPLLAAKSSEKESRQEKPSKPEKAAQPGTQESPSKPAPDAGKEPGSEGKDEQYDMTEVPPIVTHQRLTLNGRQLQYTTTTGRLPIKRGDGKIEAEMFFVAYTLDGQEAGKRPVTFAFNGGPGSASVWLHLGALGPKRVALQPEGFMPAAPYRMVDNPDTLLDRSDLVLVDAIGAGFSRASNETTAKKFWGVKGDIEAFGEFIRLYITRYERWGSPLFLLGESYGTTRAAGVAAHLADGGISFNGITLLSMVLNFQTLVDNKSNDLPYIMLVPSFTMIAGYHKKLAPDLQQNLEKARQEAAQWASTTYALALAKGDALTPEERQRIVSQLSRYTGLTEQLVSNANLRIDVVKFTHNLLLDQKLRVGRLDGRFTGLDPQGLLDTPFYDPTTAAILPPYTSVFNQYVRAELGYKSDMPYKVFAFRDDDSDAKWEWGSGIEGFPDTAKSLREALVKNPYLKVLVMEGYYDLATPYFAADYTIDHLDLTPALRNNISFARYNAGHMVYIELNSLAKMKGDLTEFMEKAIPNH